MKCGTTKPKPVRAPRVIVSEIRADWKKPYFGAVPYLDAMAELDSHLESYGLDSGEDIIIRFLANASGWRGETARRIKAELNAMLLAALAISRRCPYGVTMGT